MDDDVDLDMSMRAPYISMSESSELPMLIAEDLMWGAQPDLKDTLNVNKKVEINVNNQLENGDSQVKRIHESNSQQQQTKSTMESSLAALLCSQLLQHHQQQQQQQQQQQRHEEQHMEQQIVLSQHPNVKIQIMDQSGSFALLNRNALMVQTEETTGLFNKF